MTATRAKRKRADTAPIDAPLLSLRGAGLALALAILLCWPVLVIGTPLVFFDTKAYLESGAKVWDLALRVASAFWPAPAPDGAAGAGGGGAGAGDDGIRQIRSSVYALFAYLSSRLPGGLAALAAIQTALTLMVFFALAGAEDLRNRTRLALGAAALAGLSTLPWHASYAMPDILAAAVVLYYAVLAHRIDRIGPLWRWILMAIATFAVAGHYGYIPLAAGLVVIVLGVRAWRRTLGAGVIAMALVPIVATALINMAGSQAVTGQASVAPKRLPILLARSLEDGPAYDYLRQACPETDDLAICTLMSDLPANISDFLWAPEGIGSLTAGELDRIRAEEATILWRSFRAYPWRQSEALLGNMARQIVRVGTGDLFPAAGLNPDDPSDFAVASARRDNHPAFDLFDTVTRIGTALGIALIAWLAFRRRLGPGDGIVLLVCAAGLFGNALIFGGLSAPVDRYQSRLVWILPAIALLIWARGPRVRPG